MQRGCRSKDLLLDATALWKSVWIDEVGGTPLLGKLLGEMQVSKRN